MKKKIKYIWFSILSGVGCVSLVFSATYSQVEDSFDFFAYLPIIWQDTNQPIRSTATATRIFTSTFSPPPELTSFPTETIPLSVTPSFTPSPPPELTPLPTETIPPSVTPSFTPKATFAPNQTWVTQLVSKNYNQAAANHNSLISAISADGRFIAFQSFASNIVPNDTNESSDVFVYDWQTDETTRVSIDSDRVEGDNNSLESAISGDGRYIVFQSFASNLIISDTNPTADIFLHDRVLGETKLVPNHRRDDQEYVNSNPSISANGQTITSLSVASSPRYNDTVDLFRITINGGSPPHFNSSYSGTAPLHYMLPPLDFILNPSISGNGQHIVFESAHPFNLYPDDRPIFEINSFKKIFVVSLLGRFPQPVSLPSYDPFASKNEIRSFPAANGHSINPAISADGNLITFESLATNLVPDYSNDGPGIFMHNVETGQTRFISAGTEPSISADGRFIVYHLNNQVFIYDHNQDSAWQVSISDDGEPANGEAAYAKISADGNFISFASNATNLSDIDTDGKWNIYIHQREGGNVPQAIETPRPISILTKTPSTTRTPVLNAGRGSILVKVNID